MLSLYDINQVLKYALWLLEENEVGTAAAKLEELKGQVDALDERGYEIGR